MRNREDALVALRSHPGTTTKRSQSVHAVAIYLRAFHILCMTTETRTERSVQEGDTIRDRIVTWILLEGDRPIVAAGIVTAFVATIAVLISVDILAVGPDSFTATIFGSGLTSGVFTIVTIALSINQLILSWVFGTPDTLTARLDGSRSLRHKVEELANRPSSPTDPAAFLSLIATTLSDRAADILTVSDSPGWQAPDELTAAMEDLVAYGRNIDDSLGGNAPLSDTLGVVLGPEYALNMATVHRLRNDYSSTLPGDARVDLRAIEELLESIAVSRQFFKTMVLQQDFAALSRQLVYSGLLALVCVISLTLIYRMNTVTIPLSTLPIVISLGIGIIISPLALFAAYILRAATVARKTISVGPFIPPQNR